MIVLLMIAVPGFAALFFCFAGVVAGIAALGTALSLAGTLFVTCLNKLTATIQGGRT